MGVWFGMGWGKEGQLHLFSSPSSIHSLDHIWGALKNTDLIDLGAGLGLGTLEWDTKGLESCRVLPPTTHEALGGSLNCSLPP